MKKYWENAISFEKYMEKTREIASKEKTQLSEELQKMQEYYQLGNQRMNRVLKVYKREEDQIKKLKEKKFDGKVLIISEGWCGDAGQTVPAVSLFFKDYNEVRIAYRDENPELMEMFLTNGSRSIPIVVLLSNDFQTIAHWGPRPKYGTELLKKYQNDPENYPKTEFHNDLQVYYSKNKGKDAIEEILQLL